MALALTTGSAVRGDRVRLRAAWLLATVLCVAFALVLVMPPGKPEPTDYERELAQLDKDIAAAGGSASSPSSEVGKATESLYLLYRRAALTGEPSDADALRRALDGAMAKVGSAPDLWLIKANLDFRQHRLADARSDLDKIPGPPSAEVRALRADVALQEGNYEAAAEGYARALRARRSWDNLARVAYLKTVTGDIEGANALYAEAEGEITAKEMRAYAWLQVQLGYRDLSAGRQDTALAHYQRASRAYSGYWLVDEHIAELLAAERKFEEAVALYRSVIARKPTPDLEQALGDLYLFMGKPDDAKPWHDKALAGYRASVQRGEVQYLHHLAGFYADVREDGPEAVKWARRDLDLRGSFAVHDAMAWALYRDGRFADARGEMRQALAPGGREAHVLFHAGMIELAAGRPEEGRQRLRQAAEINPHFDAFHVHR